jgi:HD superfamily phosphodiesterase
MGGGGGAAGSQAYHRYHDRIEHARRVREMAGRIATTPSARLEQLSESLFDRVEDALIAACDALDVAAYDTRKGRQ